MVNSLYTPFRQRLLEGGIDLRAADIRVTAVNEDAGYGFNTTHETFASIPAGTRVATSGPLSGKSVANGIFDASDITLAEVAAIGGGGDIDSYVVHVTGEAGLLICYIDTGVNLNVTPNGADLVLRWDDGINRIFRI